MITGRENFMVLYKGITSQSITLAYRPNS